jgi:long-chain fatty acid transport protein
MKQKMLIVCSIISLVAILFSGSAWASGFQLIEQNASGLGNAYAGSAAVAENASTIFYNPAGMTQLQPRELSVGVSLIRPSFKFTNNGSTTPLAFGGGAATGTDGGDAGGWNFLPNGYLSWGLTKDLYAGIGFGAPFGLSTEYENIWFGRYQAVKFAIKTYNVNPSIAYRVNDKISLGFGVNWQRFDAEYVRQAHPLLGQVKLDADDDAWGCNVGVLFQITPSTKLGISYRSSINFTLEGNFSGAVNAEAMVDLKTPDTAIVSFTQGLGDRWELLGDISWTGWSSVDTLNVRYKASGALAQALEAKFNDTWRVALGASYKLSDAWKLKFGIAYDETPVPDAEHRLVSLPDNDRIAFAAGVQWKPGWTSALDFGASYLYMRDPDINNNQDSPPTLARGIVKGSYEESALILGAQYSMSF